MPARNLSNANLALQLQPIGERSIRAYAERKLAQKKAALGGAPGRETTPGPAGLIGSNGRFYREYEHGSLFYDNNADPIYVYGAIGVRYRQLGGPRSWLGWPTSNELDFVEGGRLSKFERGTIYWWPDTGAIELGNVAVRYRGLRCFGETDELSDSDEPYVLLTATPPSPDDTLRTRTRIYDDVDAGEARPDTIELYRGLPFGLSVGIVLMEHDLADPDKYRDTIKGAVAGASAAVTAATTAIPGVGLVLGPVAGAALMAVHEDIVDAINGLVGGSPDRIGTVGLDITPKQMVTMTRATRHDYNGVQYHLESPLINEREGATYKVYFDIERV